MERSKKPAKIIELKPVEIPMPVIKTDVKKSVGLGIATGLIYAALLSVSMGFLVEIQTRIILIFIMVAGLLTGTKFGFFSVKGCGLLGGAVFGFIGMFAACLFALSADVFLFSILTSKTPVSIISLVILSTAAIVLVAFALNIVLIHVYNSWRTKNINSDAHLFISFFISFLPALIILTLVIFQFITGWK